jgi:hypothetical protein
MMGHGFPNLRTTSSRQANDPQRSSLRPPRLRASAFQFQLLTETRRRGCRAGKIRFSAAYPGSPVNGIDLGQNARTTGGAGILPAAYLQ